MTIDFSCEGKVKFTLIDYIDGILQDLPDDMRVATQTHLQRINCSRLTPRIQPCWIRAKQNSSTTGQHHRTAKLLYLSKRARPDIQLSVAYLYTRVQEPNADDHAKLVRLTKYLDDTIGIPLILALDGSGKI